MKSIKKPGKIIATMSEIDVNAVLNKYVKGKAVAATTTKKGKFAISDVTCKLVAAISYAMYDLMPTRRCEVDYIYSTDARMLVENVKTRLRFVKLLNNAPIGKFTLNVTHTMEIDNPIYVMTHDIVANGPLKKFVDNVPLASIGPGHNITIEGRIVENSAYAGGSHYNFITNFSREGMTVTDEDGLAFEDCRGIEFETNHGEVTFIYQDSLSASDVLLSVKKILTEYYRDIMANFDSLVSFNVDASVISMPADHCCVMGELLAIYIYDASGRTISATCTETDDSSRVDIRSSKPMMISSTKKAIDKLISHIAEL